MVMTRYEPTREMREFAKEAIRVNALNRTGLSTAADIDRLERLGEGARTAQHRANAEQDREGQGW